MSGLFEIQDQKSRLKELVKFVESYGLDVNLHTKARGNQGILMGNRIDISKLLDTEARLGVLVHEFAHFVHLKLEPDMLKTHGSLKKLFNVFDENIIKSLQKELFEVTQFIDKYARHDRLNMLNDAAKQKVLYFDDIVKKGYPKFLRSKKFKEFGKYIKGSKAKYLLKYDVVKLVSPFLRHVETYSIKSLDKDFPDMPDAFRAYIRLCSQMRKQKRISSKISKRRAYYNRPSELFARFVQAIYLNPAEVTLIAPLSCSIFSKQLRADYYLGLSEVLDPLSFSIDCSIAQLNVVGS